MTNTNTATTTPPPASPQPPKRKIWPRRHPIISTLIAVFLAIWAVIITLGMAVNSAVNNMPGTTHAKAPAASAPAAPSSQPSQPAAPAPPPMKATKVTFVITGNVPSSEFGEVDISYGSNSDNHSVTLPNLDAQGATYTLPFDPKAEYYSVDAMFTSAGTASVKIIVSGPNMQPMVVSHGTATGSGDNSGGDASAQAAPNNSDGTSWMNEN